MFEENYFVKSNLNHRWKIFQVRILPKNFSNISFAEMIKPILTKVRKIEFSEYFTEFASIVKWVIF